MFFVNPDDPRSTAAAALSLADAIAPVLDATVASLPGRTAADAFASRTGGLDGPRLFEGRTLAALRRLRAEIAAGIERETTPAVRWEPVRYVDGAEDCEPVTVSRRTPEGDALAATGARLDLLVGLIERTRALLAADRAIEQLRQDLEGSQRPRSSGPSGPGPATDRPEGA
jgi:hypothetical protein